ncbi:MAG: 4-(cytidine 5'-diphospho)-2-C-methyl-D-erythritol kinase [Rhodothalassiaceae bacterium]
MRDAGQRVALDAPAKINLFLHITGRRGDGYHELDSIFLFTGLRDRLNALKAPAGVFDLAVSGPWGGALAAEGEDNLVLRAARALANCTGGEAGAHLELEKQIPVAAGLGGGSADAAAALRALADLWGLEGGTRDLAQLAAGIGADVPPCLAPCPWRARGIGDELSPLDGTPEWGLVLVNPRIPLPTAQVFAALREGGRPFRAPLPGRLPWRDVGWLQQMTGNDLEPAACALAPPVAEVLAALEAGGGCLLARMSGSGATCFGLYADGAAAEAAAAAIRRARPGWWVWAGGFFPEG